MTEKTPPPAAPDIPRLPKQRPEHHLFSFLIGDSLTTVVKDAADYARQHNKPVLIAYGGKNYEVHPSACSPDAQAWLIGEMQKRVAA